MPPLPLRTDGQHATDHLLARGGGAGADGWTAAWLWDDEIGNALWEVASAPAVVALMRELCGPNVCLWAGGLATKAPANGVDLEANTIPWHQDAPYAAAVAPYRYRYRCRCRCRRCECGFQHRRRAVVRTQLT